MRRGVNSIILAILLLIVILLTIHLRAGAPQPERLAINELADELNQGKVIRLIVEGNEVHVIFINGRVVSTRKEGGRTLVKQMLDLGVSEELLSSEHIHIEVKEPSSASKSNLIPLAIAGGLGIVLGAALILLAIRAGYFRE